MNANDLTFGIEIETTAPDSAVRRDHLRIGPYRRGIQVPYLPAGWTAEADGSINNGHGGHRCEIVSPILRGEEGIRPGGRGPPHAGGQRPSCQRELWSSCSHRLEAGFAERSAGPAGDDRRLRREGPLRDHRIEEPGTRNVLRRRPQIRERQRRQAEPRPQPLPRLEPDEPGPRDKGHGRVPGVLRLAQPGEGGRLDSGLPGLGRTGHQREADADLEPQAAERGLEEEPDPDRAKQSA